jgi:hypothetical protein
LEPSPAQQLQRMEGARMAGLPTHSIAGRCAAYFWNIWIEIE